FPYSNNPTFKGHNSLIRTRNHIKSVSLEISFQEISYHIWKYT
ncbi:hypothetical protein MTR67_038585, partial [Solanum verrucosum]